MGDVSYNLICAVREGELQRVNEIINLYGLSYSQIWAEGYVLLKNALHNNHIKVAKLLIEKNCTINSKSPPRSDTPLHLAAGNGNKEIVKMLLKRNAHMNVLNTFNETPIFKAYQRGNKAIFKLLLNRGANTNFGVPVLHSAVGKHDEEAVRLLLNKNASANLIASDGYAPLHIAIEKNYVAIVKHLLKFGACVNSICTSKCRGDNYAPLHFAVDKGNENIVKLLLINNAFVDAKANENTTPLHIAIKKKRKSIMELLLQDGCDVNAANNSGETVLQLAIQAGHSFLQHILHYGPDINNELNKICLNFAIYRRCKDSVDTLLEYGFTVNPADVNNTKLFYAAVKNGHLKVVQDLLKYGTDINKLCKPNNLPLHIAIKNNETEIVTLLINHGADVEAKDEKEKTPIYYAVEIANLKIINLLLNRGVVMNGNSELLFVAVKQKCKKMVELCLEHDADVNAIDTNGKVVLHYICELDWFTSYEHSDSYMKEISQIFLNRGVNVNARTKQGETPLHICAEKGNTIICKMLLENGANVHLRDENGKTPLHCATTKCRRNIIELLIKYGAKVDSQMRKDPLLLHNAAKKGFDTIISLLLKFGADVDAIDEFGRTALHIACKEGYKNVVELLLQYGSDVNIITKSNNTPLHYVVAGYTHIYDEEYCFGDEEYYFDDAYDYFDYDEYDYFDEYDFNQEQYERVAKVLKQHIITLQNANLYVSRLNLQIIQCSSMFNFHSQILQTDCKNEVELMKAEKISNTYISFYDVLTHDINNVAKYVRNKNIRDVLKSNNYDVEFPHYAAMIKSQFRKASAKCDMLQQFELIQHRIDGFSQLPYNCVEEIFDYLNIKDVEMFIEVCKDAFGVDDYSESTSD